MNNFRLKTITLLTILLFNLAVTLTISAQTTSDQTAVPTEQPVEEWRRRSSLNPFRGTTRSRLGTMSYGRMENQYYNENPRISGDGIIWGKNYRLLGVDMDDPSSRMRDNKEPDRTLLPSQFLHEKAARSEPRPESTNTVMQGDIPTRKPIRRPAGFFSRPGIMDPEAALTEAEEKGIRTPQSRWIRQPANPVGDDTTFAPGSAPGGAPNSAPGSGVGPATSIGSDLFQEQELPQQESVQQNNQRQQANIRQNALAAQRAKERKLEGMLLTDPNVHFLSPVQVSLQDGIVTVRGVVPSQQHKVAAGNVLLSDPTVSQVNNHITVLPTE